MKILFLDMVDVSLDDPEPTDYVAWFEWAELQGKAGRSQARCEDCGRFYWPHTKFCKTCNKVKA